MIDAEQTNPKYIRGSSAVEIAASVEQAIRTEGLAAGDRLPTVRALADGLEVSPATVAAAYRRLRERGLVVARGRLGTRVSGRPALPARGLAVVPEGVVDLADGNPDPELLPDLVPALRSLDPGKHLYGEPVSHAPLLRLGARQFAADRIPARHLTVTSGALDGLERALAAHLRTGDRVAVEDPAFVGVLDLLHARGFVPIPVAIDDSGPLPDALAGALEGGVDALIVTPRAQNPTGAALDASRVRGLRRVLRDHPDVLLLEDDHAGPVAGVKAFTLCDARRRRWAVVRSVSKSLGPDLRVALLTGDATTVARIEGGTIVGMRWVSHVLQGLVVAVWERPGMREALRQAGRIYSRRRAAVIDALAREGVPAHGRSGLNVWIPVPEEAAAATQLVEAGWAVTAGERFRLETPPAIRACVARLPTDRAPEFARTVARVVRGGSGLPVV